VGDDGLAGLVTCGHCYCERLLEFLSIAEIRNLLEVNLSDTSPSPGVFVSYPEGHGPIVNMVQARHHAQPYAAVFSFKKPL